ncbi:MAG: Zn-dependent hydrolase [Bacteroidales bacterium]|nr:Zn-dependent hydrolase [Bacteroidales bacterium]MBP5373893.1 Zn-dependent hydrolase [Bacteroidales bacterium]
MKRFIFAMGALALLLSSCGEHRSRTERLLGNYALVTIPAPDLSGITDNGKEVLNLYRFAADEADKIYWEQNFGDKESFLASLTDPSQKEYALINYGPWDRLDGKAFVSGYSDKPAGAGFYPEDMTPEEWEAFDDPAKNSPYTLIRRDADGNLVCVWYHDAYASHIEKICSYLNAAADITIKESVRKYLLSKIEGLRSDDYYESDHAWLEMTDSKMDLVLGPNEAVDDALYGRKASFGAYVLLKNLERTEQLNALSARLEEFQQLLPGDPAYHSFTPGSESDIFSCNVIYYGGYTNAGFKVIAINFPYDERVQEELGTRTILFDNIIREKFNRTVFPVGMTLFETDQQAHLDASAFYWGIVFRELAKGLGVKETINGKGSVADALGNEALVLEKAKSNVLGAWLCASQVNAHHIQALIQKEDVLTTFVANIIRSCRFGAADPTGQANLLVYNYLAEQGAISRKASGRYDIDCRLTESALENLGALILKIQATGDREAAVALVQKYSVESASILADKVSLELEKIPVDIRFTYEK